MKLQVDFYERDNVTLISRELLGKMLFTKINGTVTGGMIVEVEAYCGINDKACHANNNRRTKRTEIMYHGGGVAYVYLCYGIHYLFNIVTNVEGRADAILVRAVEPVEGMEKMMERRKMNHLQKRLTAGPGALTQALGIDRSHYGESLLGDCIWLEDAGIKLKKNEIQAGPRIGVDYAGDDALLPWRFTVKNNPWLSR